MAPNRWIFFQQCSHNQRDLPSFPTRRSSDLSLDTDDVAGEGDAQHDLRLKSVVDEANERRIMRQRDRKSTRLNSSHTVSSYAVVCLKKKKALLLGARRHVEGA